MLEINLIWKNTISMLRNATQEVRQNSTYITNVYADSKFHPAAVLSGRMVSEQRVGKDSEGSEIGIFLE